MRRNLLPPHPKWPPLNYADFLLGFANRTLFFICRLVTFVLLLKDSIEVFRELPKANLLLQLEN